MQHLFKSWEALSHIIADTSHILLLSDYDGTLTPIVSRPEEAVLSPEVRAKLRALADKSAFTIGIISGRSLAEIQVMVGLRGIYYSGNHGFEIAGPSLKFTNPAAETARTEIKTLARQLANKLDHITWEMTRLMKMPSEFSVTRRAGVYLSARRIPLLTLNIS